MAIIPQPSFFSWDQLAELGDLERLMLVLDTVPDEALMRRLETARGRGRNDYPVRALWNSVLAGIVFQHASIESLRRELGRNAQLRTLCGFRGTTPPRASTYTRFLQQVLREESAITALVDQLVESLREILPEFGERLAMDGKAIPSWANRPNPAAAPDGRRDLDADFGRKEYRGGRPDGSAWVKVVKWFGYKLHLVVDATYELPVGFTVTKASTADISQALPLLEQLHDRHPELLDRTEVLTADRGYDDTKLLSACWDRYQIKPVIDIRNMWKGSDATRLLGNHSTVTYNFKGQVFCYDPVTGTVREMANGGFEAARNTLKKRCPARLAGGTCAGAGQCPVAQGFRIPLETDRRVFTPIDRASYKWEREYDRRTAVERVNSRLDVSFGFELHTIRGLKKMRLRSGLALIVMLAMALGRIRQQRPELTRSLVRSA